MTQRQIQINLYEILDNVVAAHLYDYAHPMLLCSFAQMLGSLSDEEIEGYCKTTLRLGYDSEAYFRAKDILNRFKDDFLTN